MNYLWDSRLFAIIGWRGHGFLQKKHHLHNRKWTLEQLILQEKLLENNFSEFC